MPTPSGKAGERRTRARRSTAPTPGWRQESSADFQKTSKKHLITGHCVHGNKRQRGGAERQQRGKKSVISLPAGSGSRNAGQALPERQGRRGGDRDGRGELRERKPRRALPLADEIVARARIARLDQRSVACPPGPRLINLRVADEESIGGGWSLRWPSS